jgi:hypothetical protein
MAAIGSMDASGQDGAHQDAAAIYRETGGPYAEVGRTLNNLGAALMGGVVT